MPRIGVGGLAALRERALEDPLEELGVGVRRHGGADATTAP